MNKNHLHTLFELCANPNLKPITQATLTIVTKDGERPAKVRVSSKRSDINMIVDIGIPVTQHLIIDQFKSRVFTFQTTPPSRQTPGT